MKKTKRNKHGGRSKAIYAQATRLFRLLSFMQGRYITADSLAKRYGVSTRQVYRDLGALKKCLSIYPNGGHLESFKVRGGVVRWGVE